MDKGVDCLCGGGATPLKQGGRLTAVTTWGKEAKIHLCGSCGHVFFHPSPSERELAEYYNGPWNAGTNFSIDDSLGMWVYKLQEYEPQRTFVEAILRLRDQHFPGATEPVVVHDASCGYGALVTKLNALGFDATGSDIDGQAVSVAQNRGNLRVSQRRLLADLDEILPNGADIITCYHAAEHYVNPVEFFHQVKGCLRDGGVFLMAVPNGAFLPARTDYFGKFDWCMYPGHLQYFTPSSAKVFLGIAGLRVIETFSYPWEWPQKDWLLECTTGLPASKLPKPESLLQALADNALTRDLRVVAIKDSTTAEPSREHRHSRL